MTEVQDSMRSSLHYFYGVITDDYGFTELRFNYSVHHAAYTVVPINIAKNTNTQEFYFSFDFAEFGGMDKSEVSYFLKYLIMIIYPVRKVLVLSIKPMRYQT